ncbi:hypothetical protein [Halalkalibacter okhensis]|nr:hypothetical protein [Halalkalibacter okhensis]
MVKKYKGYLLAYIGFLVYTFVSEETYSLVVFIMITASFAFVVWMVENL